MSGASPDGPSPGPRVTLRVGITGHRLDKLPGADLPRLRACLADLFASLDASCQRLAGPVPGAMPQVHLVSALAEGADRLAVEAAPAHWPLAALLPMPRDEYRRDFLADGEETSASAAAFDRLLAAALTVTECPMATGPPGIPAPPRELQYAALGEALVRQIDCLVAVWDGQPPKGPGGTAGVVADAVALGLPVLWVDPTGAAPTRLVTGFAKGDLARPETREVDGAVLGGLVGAAVGLRPAQGVKRPGRPS